MLAINCKSSGAGSQKGDNMLEWLKQKILTKYTGSIIRTVLAALGGYLIAQYGLDSEIVEKFISSTTEVLVAVLPLVIAQIWSLIQKYKN